MEKAKKFIWAQFVILLCGTIFAWFNFFNELINWLNKRACTTGCAIGLVNPFLTPCFYGAIFFLISFIVSIMIVSAFKKQ